MEEDQRVPMEGSLKQQKIDIAKKKTEDAAALKASQLTNEVRQREREDRGGI